MANYGFTVKDNHFERNPEATIYVGNIDTKVNSDLIWELFSQCGIVNNVHLPKEQISADHQGYGFVEFKSEEDADYAIKIMHMIKLHGKPIKVNKASQEKKTQEVGANLFVGNLDPEVDEKILYDTFQTFGLILSTRIQRDPDRGGSKGFGFVIYDNFESSDAAIAALNGQFFNNKVISVQYAYKKDSKGERHGSAAERMLAANRPQSKLPQNQPGFDRYHDETLNNYQGYQPPVQGYNGISQKIQQTLHMPDNLIPNATLPQIPGNMPPPPPPPTQQQTQQQNYFPMPPVPPPGLNLPPPPPSIFATGQNAPPMSNMPPPPPPPVSQNNQQQ